MGSFSWAWPPWHLPMPTTAMAAMAATATAVDTTVERGPLTPSPRLRLTPSLPPRLRLMPMPTMVMPVTAVSMEATAIPMAVMAVDTDTTDARRGPPRLSPTTAMVVMEVTDTDADTDTAVDTDTTDKMFAPR